MTCFLAGALLLPGARFAEAAPTPTLVMYPGASESSDDLRALMDLRKKLRADGQFEVLTYDPAAAAMVRAANDAHHPEWLTGPMTSDSDRLALTRALGAAFYVVVSKSAERGKSDARLRETASAARAWRVTGKKTDDAAHAIEEQAALVLTAPPSVPPVTTPTPAATPPTPAVAPVAVPTPVPSASPPPVAPVPITPTAPVAPVTVSPLVPPAVPPAPVTPPSPSPAPISAPVENPIPPAPMSAPVASPIAAPHLPSRPVIVAPSVTPIPAPATIPAPFVSPPSAPPAPVIKAPTTTVPSVTPLPVPVSVPKANAPVEDLSAVTPALSAGDAELARGNFVGAIWEYRDAVNGAPLSTTPRLKLAQAYLEADMRDKALNEAERALEIAPDSKPLQQFLLRLDAQSGGADGAVARFTVQVNQNPQDPEAHLELGDALWNNSAVAQAEEEYKTAQNLAGSGTVAFGAAAAHLARLYAAQSRYDASLAALKDAGAGGYALALEMVQSRADTLSSTLDVARDSFAAGKSTHADFYKVAGDVSAQAQSLADFVVKVAPPPAFKISHLYRIQATHLMAQQAAVLVTYVETTDSAQADKAAQLGKEAQTAMLTAHAAEEKLGLWGGKQTEAKK